MSYGAIRSYAERIGEHHQIYDGSGSADIEALVEDLGGTIEVAHEDESLHVVDEGDFVIYVPPTTSSRRDRFTVAHELGHYFLHYLYLEKKGRATFGRGGRSRSETEANVFASSLLMPEDPFRDAHAELGADVNALARRFDVSPAAADVRCQVLGLER
ncbi:ImmA/IrrE family metallo-endopeptidase [Nocardioides sp. R-C-SC26]|uniref:ImmA/IrrE family metallo-endopeptidase n=1 Tax=Nocardioides sp. R-C-SC26 TaxID=2870414 RepID=UPI001E5CD4FB|nr:ImmA/IrrE family metallo-endopeptidase [Nocardioides sp. R-C-SC26]